MQDRIQGRLMFQELLKQIKEGEFDFPISAGGWIHPGGEVEQFDKYYFEKHWEDALKKLYGKDYYTEKPDNGVEAEKAAEEYERQGHIRFTVYENDLNIESYTKPTTLQMLAIGRMARKYSKFYGDIFSEKGKKLPDPGMNSEMQ